jgi:hypothetical protein
MSDSENPRAVIGGNFPPVPTPVEIKELLKDSFARTVDGIKDIAARVTALTKPIHNDDELRAASDTVKQMRSARADWEMSRVGAKSPYMDAERAVDGYFVPVRDRMDALLRELEHHCSVYLREKEATARAAREAEARKLREDEERRRQEAERARQAEEAARLKAEQAKTAKARERAEQEAAVQAARAAAAKASADAMDSAATLAEGQAESSRSAEFARTRGDRSLATLADTWSFEVEDWNVLQYDGPLRPFISRDAIEKAIRAFVKVNKDKAQLPGVRIFADRKAQIR